MPTVWRERGYRFFFFSNERNEPPHVHVQSGDGYAKVWLTPVSLAQSVGYDASELRDVLVILSYLLPARKRPSTRTQRRRPTARALPDRQSRRWRRQAPWGNVAHGDRESC